jgi:hypothetical protein
MENPHQVAMTSLKPFQAEMTREVNEAMADFKAR